MISETSSFSRKSDINKDFNKLCLNEPLTGIKRTAPSLRQSIKLKKRRFKEIDNKWQLNLDSETKNLIATQEDSQPGPNIVECSKSEMLSDCSDTTTKKSVVGSSNRRQIKLQYKRLNRMALELDVQRGQRI